MPLRLPRVRITRRRVITASVVLAVIVAALAWAVWPKPRGFTTQEGVVLVQSGPGGNEPVVLDTTLYLPRSAGSDNPVPAILLAHGFGGTKQSVREDAGDFAGRGYAVMTWTARGFGASGGEIHLDSPDYEVRDAQGLIDLLAAAVGHRQGRGRATRRSRRSVARTAVRSRSSSPARIRGSTPSFP